MKESAMVKSLAWIRKWIFVPEIRELEAKLATMEKVLEAAGLRLQVEKETTAELEHKLELETNSAEMFARLADKYQKKSYYYQSKVKGLRHMVRLRFKS